MTDEQIDAVFNAMPGGPAGFCKEWGYRQFARALLDPISMKTAQGQTIERLQGTLTARNEEIRTLRQLYCAVSAAYETLNAGPEMLRDDGWFSVDGGMSWHHPAPNAAAPLVPTGCSKNLTIGS